MMLKNMNKKLKIMNTLKITYKIKDYRKFYKDASNTNAENMGKYRFANIWRKVEAKFKWKVIPKEEFEKLMNKDYGEIL